MDEYLIKHMIEWVWDQWRLYSDSSPDTLANVILGEFGCTQEEAEAAARIALSPLE